MLLKTEKTKTKKMRTPLTFPIPRMSKSYSSLRHRSSIKKIKHFKLEPNNKDQHRP